VLYYLLYEVLRRYFSPLNVFRYITVSHGLRQLNGHVSGSRFRPLADSPFA